MATQPCVPCADYRAEKRLLSLKRQLSADDLSPEERQRLEAEVAELERLLGMD
ncbi:MAG: hypothetical protein K9K66_17875 [Desulfarculaceae bacterium]|nr:hypothetical protein [Desulfarculaceae bacterium]MCF8073360.1 hypothetical protein [Desulfarculaceae bacterium]MCF8103530.1 hypothetical protein [Desulfarculaceae bacterium]MCF8115771.1 hypothetical protein [Desulfarculaceae bacterium]